MDATKPHLLQAIFFNYILINEQESEVISTGWCVLYLIRLIKGMALIFEEMGLSSQFILSLILMFFSFSELFP